MQRVIGIDFGTSTTYMAVKRYNGDKPAEDAFSYMPVVFNYGESNGFVASVARKNADGTFDFGEKATEELEGATIYTGFKMLLESPDEQERSTARHIIKAFFKYLYETYTQQAADLGDADDTEETLISHPVKWREASVAFLLMAARMAGFQNVREMDEATAAVSTVLCQNRKLIRPGESGYLMLADMGAGTTDLVICSYEMPNSQKINVKRVLSWPQDTKEPTFGGREIDAILENYVEDYLAKSLKPELASQAHEIAVYPGSAKGWKEKTVSPVLADGKQVTTCSYIGMYKASVSSKFPAFGRAEFQQMAEKGLRDYCRLLKDCLDAACQTDQQFSASGLDMVILTGGHSAWYFARQIVDGTMAGYLEHPALAKVRAEKNRVFNLPNPQSTVCRGLVYSKLPFGLTNMEEGGGPTDLGGGSGSEQGGTDSGGPGPEQESTSGSQHSDQKGSTSVIQEQTDGGKIDDGPGGEPLPPEEEWTYDSSICPKCGSSIPDKKRRCPVCGRKRLPILKTPFKLGLISMIVGERRIGLAKATGSFTVFDDRVEYDRWIGNAAALLTPYTAVYSLVKAQRMAKDIFWLKEIADVKESVYGIGGTCIVITMRTGEKFTFTGFSGESGRDKAKAVVELIRQKRDSLWRSFCYE